ncbi:unnamed protein product [Rhodiola kirilowii]
MWQVSHVFLQNVKSLEPVLDVIMPNGGTSTLTHIGTCKLNENITLMDVLYVLEFRFNLLSVGKLAKDSCLYVNFTDNECSIQDHTRRKALVTGALSDGLYQVQMAGIKAFRVNKDSSTIWHNRLGHYPFKLIHSDILGPFATPSVTGAKYFLTVVDDYSRSTWTFMMQTKADAADHLINFFHMVHTQFNKRVKLIRTDNGSEFFSKKVTELFATQGCLHQASCPYTPEQNGVVERKHRHLLEVAKAIKFKADILTAIGLIVS